MFISSIRIYDQVDDHNVPIEQLQQFDIELARQSVHCKLEHQKILQRQLKKSNNKSPIGLYEILNSLFKKTMYSPFQLIKGQKKVQDVDVQDDHVRNLSVIASKLGQKIKTKNLKAQKIELTHRLEQIFRRNIAYEKQILKQKFYIWMTNITFPRQYYHDFEIRLKVLQNEKEVLMTDIEQLEAINAELMTTMNQAKMTFLSEESNFNTSNKNEQKQIEIQRFDIQENLTSQKEFMIAFEYVEYLKEDNINLKKQYQKNEQLMMEEMQQLENELQALEKELED